MAFLHTQSCECIVSPLDLFAVPSTQTSITNGNWTEYKPLSNITEEGPIEFCVHGSGDEYLDLSQTLLYLNVKITKETGANLEATDNIAGVNNLVHSLFSQVDVYLNQKLVSPPNNTYNYKSYIENILNYGPAAKASHLTCGLWNADTCGKMDNVDDENSGFTQRKAYTERSKQLDLIGHIHCDIFNQDKFLLNGVELRVKLVRSRTAFVLMGTAGAAGKLQINDASLLVRRNTISPTVLLAHAKALNSTTAKYPITRTEIKVVTIPAGLRGKTLDNVFLGQLPKRCVIGFVSNQAFNGDITTNPYNFKNYDMNFLCLYVDNQQFPSKPLQPTFTGTNKLYVNNYHSLFSGTSIHFSNQGNDISRDNYADGYCLAVFDLTPDLSAGTASHWNLVKNGNVRIEVRFGTALPETVNMLAYAEFDNVIEIDKHRNVAVDYNS